MSEKSAQHRLKKLYQPPRNTITEVDVPEMQFMVVDGRGDPGRNGIDETIKWLYAVAHFLIPIARARMGKHFLYPPVECLFWATDEKDFITGNKEKWHWRTMIPLADWMTREMVDSAIAQAEEKRGAPSSWPVRLERFREGRCVQRLHVGDYSGIGALCKSLYQEYLPDNDLVPNGPYHEIYLNDPGRKEPARRKVLIRQPVKPLLVGR